MPRSLLRVGLLATALLLAVSIATVPAIATHNNQGTVKVHDDEDENPDQRNVPHVDCDFWIEGFNMGDDSGWIVFYSWPPTGDKTQVESGEDQDWTADSGELHDHHFLAGPFTLATGHYRVEVYTDAGHPGSNDDGNPHFAKAKTFWVECEEAVVNPPCPVIVDVRATSDDGEASITLDWSSVLLAEAYVVYRAVEGEDFDQIGETTSSVTEFTDTDVEVGVTYEYYVTAVIDGVESENCAIVEASAIPFFPTLLVGALAMVGSVGAYLWMRRKA